MFSRAELKSFAREKLRGKIGSLFLCYLVIFFITLLATLIMSIFQFLAEDNLATISVLQIIISSATYVIGAGFNISLAIIYLNIVNNDTVPQVGDIFYGFKNFGRAVILYLLVVIFTFLWSLLLVIPGIIKSISYSFSPYILVENPNMSPSEAINESKRITNGHKMELFILGLSFIPWILLSVITFGIASIYVIPYVNTTYVNYYNRLKLADTEKESNNEQWNNS